MEEYKDNIYLKDVKIMNFTQTKEEGEKVGVIKLYNKISDSNGNYGETGWNGQQFADAISLYERYGYDRIEVRIISEGGEVIDGMRMVRAILDCKIPIDTYNDYIAASMGGIILLAGDNIYCQDNSIFMMHNPYMVNKNEDKIAGIFQKTIDKLFQKRTDLFISEIRDFMEKETWFDADEQVKYGFADVILPSTKRKIKTEEESKILLDKYLIKYKEDKKHKNVFSEDKIKSLYDPKKTENFEKYINKIEKKMKNEILNILKIEDESKILDTLTEMVSQKDSALNNLHTSIESVNDMKAEKEKLEKELNDLKNSIKTEKEENEKQKIETALNTFIAEGKVKEEEKDKYSNLLKADFETISNLLTEQKVVNVKKSPDLNVLIDAKSDKEDRSAWTMYDWFKNDKEGLAKMEKENPTMFNSLK